MCLCKYRQTKSKKKIQSFYKIPIETPTVLGEDMSLTKCDNWDCLALKVALQPMVRLKTSFLLALATTLSLSFLNPSWLDILQRNGLSWLESLTPTFLRTNKMSTSHSKQRYFGMYSLFILTFFPHFIALFQFQSLVLSWKCFS